MKPTVVDAIAKFSKTAKGVISRLAYADLLKETGRPTLIILDDALVHGDDQRLEQIKHVLVLLFTCHPAAWRDMGAAPRTISLLAAEPT